MIYSGTILFPVTTRGLNEKLMTEKLTLKLEQHDYFLPSFREIYLIHREYSFIYICFDHFPFLSK